MYLIKSLNSLTVSSLVLSLNPLLSVITTLQEPIYSPAMHILRCLAVARGAQGHPWKTRVADSLRHP